MKRAFLVLGAVGVLSFLQLDCGSSAVSCEEALTCGGTDGGGTTDGGGEGGTVQPPAGCDPALDPKDAPNCVVNEYGVFVDGAGGNDGNAGTREAPVKTIGAALGKLGGKPRVYICEGTYAESVKLTSAVSLYGGFACGGSWQHTGGKVKVAPTAPGYALEIAGTTSPVTVSDLAFVAPSAENKGASSIAAFVHGAASVAFVRSALEAGAAKEGADGEPGTTGTITAVSGGGALDASGYPASGTTAGTIKTCTCSGGGESKGAAGGGPSGAGALGQPDLGSGVGGLANTSCTAGEPNGAGNNGGDAPAASSAAKPTALGLLDAKGWAPRSGSAGPSGTPGQGGGGGGGRDGAGGGGGCGGCGGIGGKGGAGGGASVALLSFESTVVLRGSTLLTKSAGAGGGGGAKGVAASGGGGKAGGVQAPFDGCPGGDGGRGGDGGAGSGGAGGISAGVLYRGTKPTAEATTFTIGAFGTKGIGGEAGVNDGIDGVKGDMVEAPAP